MRRLCGWHCRVAGNAQLRDFEFGFDSRGYANVRPKHGEIVEGVLYEIDSEGLGMLDNFEDYPEVFDRSEVRVIADEKLVTAWVYLKSIKEFGGIARMEYLERVIRGAESNHLPENWIEKLKSFAH